MKKNKKRIIIIGGVALLIVIIIGIILFSIFSNKNRLTINERKWISDNQGILQNINIINDVNTFGNLGKGVFYDFINDFGKQHNLDINHVTIGKEDNVDGLSFKITTDPTANDLIFYEDHFVLISKTSEVFKNVNDMSTKKVGVISSYSSYVSNYLNAVNNITFVQYESFTELKDALSEGKEISYALIPLNEYLDQILTDNYSIVYHLGDIKVYYTFQYTNDLVGNIIRKYYNTWIKDSFAESYNQSYLNLFIEKLNIAQKDQDILTNKVYNYGFIENSPYEVIMGGNYGGIVSTYLKYFSDFSGVEFRFVKYKSISALNSAISKKEVDIYFSTTENSDDYQLVPSLQSINFSVIAQTSNYLTVNSISSLNDIDVYTLEGSPIATYLTTNNINVHTEKTYKDLFKKAKNDIVIAIDTNILNYYSKNELKNFTARYNQTLDQTYNFKTNVDDTFYQIMSKYINTLDPVTITNIGLENHALTVKNGSLLSKLASYILGILLLAAIVFALTYRYTRRIKITKKIKKEDRMRFIDQLTSLKNRNYLNENIASWNKNSIYPQTCVIMDLNDIQGINDTLGYDQGDTQIKAAANILIKTQLDNSDIIRTDGNEFLIYLVGYQEKQIISFIRKLYKELKNLPFDYGAVVGYSMINDDLKTIEDAINEAVDDMRSKKEEVFKE